MPYYKPDEKGALVPASGEITQEAILAIERADDEAIVQHLTSDFASEFFIYSYPIKGGQVVGIGVDGAKEVARLLGNIEVLPDIRIDKDSDPDYFYATVRVRDWRTNVTMLGVGRCCKFIVGANWELTDRKDEAAFVKSVNKGIRNAILAVAPQEALAKIIQGFIEQKKLKRLPPTYDKPEAPQDRAIAKVGTEEQVLKKLRQQVGIEAGKAFKTEEERKAWQKKEYDIDSMTQLSEEQLKDMLSKVKAMAAQKPDATKLGFSSQVQQTDMRRELLDLIRGIGKQTDEQIREYVTSKGWGKTVEMTKEQLEACIEEVKKEKALVDEAASIPEEL